jgi:hypothetical protein
MQEDSVTLALAARGNQKCIAPVIPAAIGFKKHIDLGARTGHPKGTIVKLRITALT